MKLKPIIVSLLETDAYKFSMGQVVFHNFSRYTTTWSFKCRNKNVRFTDDMVEEIKSQIAHYCSLRFSEDELEWLKERLPWIHSDYIDFLRLWHPFIDEIHINEPGMESYNDCGLAIEARGTWLNTSMYEIAILAIVNEVYFAFTYGIGSRDEEFKERTIEKFNLFENQSEVDKIASQYSGTPAFIEKLDEYAKTHYSPFTFSEFGMRRRYSHTMQDWLIGYIVGKNIDGFVGTSNVYLAKKYGVKAVGTQAHEYFMAFQGNFELNPAYSNKFALHYWVKEYETDLGIALTDTLGTEVFLKDFTKTYAKLFSGVRHDSGDPYEWGETMISHYSNLGFNPSEKTLLFSDSLNFEKASKLQKHFQGRANVAFGIGTYLSCPFEDSLNIVFKMTECNGSPVAKLSNTPGKGMCRDEKYVKYLQRCIDWRLMHGR